MAEEQGTRLEQLQARRYTVQNQLSSVRTRLKGNPGEEKVRMYEERRTALLTERAALAAEIKALTASGAPN
jgi:hypothetical protein